MVGSLEYSTVSCHVESDDKIVCWVDMRGMPLARARILTIWTFLPRFYGLSDEGNSGRQTVV